MYCGRVQVTTGLLSAALALEGLMKAPARVGLPARHVMRAPSPLDSSLGAHGLCHTLPAPVFDSSNAQIPLDLYWSPISHLYVQIE